MCEILTTFDISFDNVMKAFLTADFPVKMTLLFKNVINWKF